MLKTESSESHGTTVTATFNKEHLDYTPLGDVISSIITLIQGHPNTDFLFSHKSENLNVSLDTRELRAVLGDVSLAEFEILEWISAYLNEQYGNINKK